VDVRYLSSSSRLETLLNKKYRDVSMPIMDGIEAARCMRIVEKSRGWARSRIVAITGLSQSQTAEILGDGEGSESEDALDEWLVYVSSFFPYTLGMLLILARRFIEKDKLI